MNIFATQVYTERRMLLLHQDKHNHGTELSNRKISVKHFVARCSFVMFVCRAVLPGTCKVLEFWIHYKYNSAN